MSIEAIPSPVLRLTSAAVVLSALLTAAGGAQSPPSALASPYAEQQDVTLTGLLPAEAASLSAGAGMALALPAEVNGFPGPRHVLDAADAGELELDADQRREIQVLFDRMHAEAVAKGQEILAAEAYLAKRFRHGDIDESTLAELVDRIAGLRGELRLVHLRTHLETRALLTAGQIERYRTLRGYHAAAKEGHAPGSVHHRR